MQDKSVMENKFIGNHAIAHGVDAVRKASLASLGYPPEWITSNREAGDVIKELEK